MREGTLFIFVSWSQRPRSTLALCLLNVSMIQAIDFIRSLSNFISKLLMMRGGTLVIFHRVKCLIHAPFTSHFNKATNVELCCLSTLVPHSHSAAGFYITNLCLCHKIAWGIISICFVNPSVILSNLVCLLNSYILARF